MGGPAGAGTSTYAERWEREGMVRLSFDVEMWRRGISTRASRGGHSDDFVVSEDLVAHSSTTPSHRRQTQAR